MIYGIGIDNIEVDRVAKSLSTLASFKTNIFTPQEIQYCDSKLKNTESYAARFAGKEAFFKALGTGWRDQLKWTDLSIVPDELGKPVFHAEGKASEILKQIGVTTIHVSLTHLKTIASAVVILEKQ